MSVPWLVGGEEDAVAAVAKAAAVGWGVSVAAEGGSVEAEAAGSEAVAVAGSEGGSVASAEGGSAVSAVSAVSAGSRNRQTCYTLSTSGSPNCHIA